MGGEFGLELGPVFEGLKQVSNYPAIESAMKELRKPAAEGGFDLNPFNQDDDEFGIVGEIKNNVALVGNLIHQVIVGVEQLAVELELLSSSDMKLEAAATIVANAIKLPSYLFFLKPVKKPIVRHLIVAAVEFLNKKFGKDWLAQVESKPAF